MDLGHARTGHALYPLVVGLLAVGCGTNPSTDGGALDSSIPPLDAITYDTPVNPDAVPTPVDAPPPPDGALPASFFPAPAAPFGPTTDTPRTVQVSVSGEALAEFGYDFSTTPTASQSVFVDGWQLRFERYLVILDHVRLNQPGADPTMQSSVGGLVAQQNGPWAVNLHTHGSLTGAGGAPETATPMFAFAGPTAGGSFDATVRYAFSFDTVPATAAVHNLNLVPADEADLLAMIAHGWTKFFSGTATYQGDAAPAGSPLADYPRTVHFGFGFGDPASYINCENPDLMMTGAEPPRGVQPSATGKVRAQVTMHTDHFFWDQSDVEGTPLHFDPIAARAQGLGTDPAGTHEVNLTNLTGDNPTALADTLARPVPNRILGALETSMMDLHPPPSYGIGATGAATIRDYRDFVTYNARGQGHLNSNGLCYVRPSAPITY